jgi:hypothetical protein
MLEVSRDAVAAGEEQLASCATEQRKYCSICTVTFGPCGDLPVSSWGRWQCLRGGADGLNGFLPPAVAALNIGAGACWGETCGDMLEAMARIVPSQSNEAMARIASCRNKTNHSTPICRLLISVSAFNFRVEGDLARKGGKIPPPPPRRQIAQFDVQPSRNFSDPPCSAASFEVNSEPHTQARQRNFLFSVPNCQVEP